MDVRDVVNGCGVIYNDSGAGSADGAAAGAAVAGESPGRATNEKVMALRKVEPSRTDCVKDL